MNIVSWNVNGLRAALKRGFLTHIEGLLPDVLCLQETKMERGQAEVDLRGFYEYWNSAQKKGYSGTAVFSRTEPMDVQNGIDNPPFDQEGRVITLQYPQFYLVNVYTPNAQHELKRLAFRMEWEDAFRAYLCGLDEKKPVVVCGDMNVAHQTIDIKNAASNRKNPGFTDEERAKMTELQKSGFCDSFRALHPDEVRYTWWSYRANARANNVGWRIDYFLVSDRLMPKVERAEIFDHISGSDHCPVGLSLDFSGPGDL